MTLVDPLVSIVLPTYNGAKYVSDAIASCHHQTYANWELIVVDDASTDETQQIVTDWAAKDRRIRLVRNATNQQLPQSLNVGFANAVGKYYTWTSDDNLYRPEAIERMVRFLERTAADIVYCDYSLIGHDGEIKGLVKVDEASCLAFRNCVRACFMYRREVHGTLGGYATDVVLAEDFDFWIRASKLFELVPLHEDLYLYRVHESSLSERKRDEVLAATAVVLARHLPELDWASRRARSQGYFVLATISEHCGNRRAACLHLLRAFSLDPRLPFGRFQRRGTTRILFGRRTDSAVSRLANRESESRSRL